MKPFLGRLLPGFTCAAVLVLSACVASAFPDLFELERSALWRGQVWRLWTGHLVHGNTIHFAYDVGAAALLGLACRPTRHFLCAAPLISIALFGAMPEVQYYYGLSAWLHAWVVAIAAGIVLREGGTRAFVAKAVLLGTLAKACLEAWLGESVLTSDSDFGGPVLHVSHLVGVGVGAAHAAWIDRATERETPSTGGPAPRVGVDETEPGPYFRCRSVPVRKDRRPPAIPRR